MRLPLLMVFSGSPEALIAVDVVQVIKCNLEPFYHAQLPFTEPFPGIVILLVRFVVPFGVSDLALEEIVVFGFVFPHSVPGGPLGECSSSQRRRRSLP